MILSAQTIRRLCLASAAPLVSPFAERTVVNGMTYGLGPCGYDIRAREARRVFIGSFALGSSIERFEMPLDVVGFVSDKSTWARCGLAVQNTIIEPGWRGYLTIELTNHGPAPLDVAAGDPIAQVLFARLDEPTELPYAGKYQDQPPHAVPHIHE